MFLSEDLSQEPSDRVYTGTWRGTETNAYHRREHASHAPDIKAVVVQLVPDEQLRRLVIARPDSNVIGRAGMIKLGQSPVDQSQLHGFK